MLYLVAMVQPIMPLIEYNANKEYIVSVLCENRNKPELACNGKCYLNKKIEQSKNHDSHDHSIPKIDLSKYPVSLISYYSCKIEENVTYQKSFFFSFIEQPQKYSSSLFRPPIS